MKGVEELAGQLLENIHTTTELKNISVALETLTQSDSFKSHTRQIALDNKLTHSLKKSQILYLFKDLGLPILYDFIDDLLAKEEYWLFASKQFDYFDEFVQAFQLLTEKVMIVNVVTAIEIKPRDLTALAKDLSETIGQQAILHLQINPSIKGGAQIRIGNLVFDYSLKSKFSQFERQWVSRMEKTSALVGRD